jgi:hypothetical protein
VNPFLHGQQINNITHEIEPLKLNAIKELKQLFCFAVRAAKVDIGYPDRPTGERVVRLNLQHGCNRPLDTGFSFWL